MGESSSKNSTKSNIQNKSKMLKEERIFGEASPMGCGTQLSQGFQGSQLVTLVSKGMVYLQGLFQEKKTQKKVELGIKALGWRRYLTTEIYILISKSPINSNKSQYNFKVKHSCQCVTIFFSVKANIGSVLLF